MCHHIDTQLFMSLSIISKPWLILSVVIVRLDTLLFASSMLAQLHSLLCIFDSDVLGLAAICFSDLNCDLWTARFRSYSVDLPSWHPRLHWFASPCRPDPPKPAAQADTNTYTQL